MDFNNFKFDKPFYPERELLKIIPIKRSTFYAWQSEWIAKGNDPALMGKVLEAIKEEWIKNNFKITKERVKEIIRSHSN